ncbi:hypothetical protein AO064_23955 [Pseudomonas marginalis]|uniref:Uncharacterized protein n=1 Tax=Pseudomonas marginalis TaxID=298 RepID=A0A9X5QKS6_PSEMA|nr:hypothetical protein AO064_23955 [Pseudomonas marginalis]
MKCFIFYKRQRFELRQTERTTLPFFDAGWHILHYFTVFKAVFTGKAEALHTLKVNYLFVYWEMVLWPCHRVATFCHCGSYTIYRGRSAFPLGEFR